jgi:5'-nucleotidase
MVEPINKIGIHASCIGNHDFDHGLDELEELIQDTNCPWILSNMKLKETGKTLANAHEELILNHSNRKIGIVGVGESDWLTTLRSFDIDDVDYIDFIECAKMKAKKYTE